jgi:citrate synthase
VALAEVDVPFEAVFDLLVDGADPEVPFAPFPPCTAGLPSAPAEGDTVFSRLLVLVARLVAHDELRLAVTGAVERRRRRELVRRMIAGCGPSPAPAALTAPTVGEALAHALRVDPTQASTLSRALVVCADHELNASTFAARVAASTGADTGSCVAAALATLSGPRHGGATDRVERLLRPVVDGASARRVLTDTLAAGDGVPGFGHRLYPDGDPRASALVRWALERAPAAAEPLRLFTALATEATGEHPTLDIGLVVLGRALGLPAGGPAALFAIGRTAGWIAHVEEQRRGGKLLRPRAVPSR